MSFPVVHCVLTLASRAAASIRASLAICLRYKKKTQLGDRGARLR